MATVKHLHIAASTISPFSIRSSTVIIECAGPSVVEMVTSAQGLSSGILSRLQEGETGLMYVLGRQSIGSQESVACEALLRLPFSHLQHVW